MLFSDAAKLYLTCLRHERGASPKTILGYQAYLRRFEKWLTEKGYASASSLATLSHFTTPTIRRYQITLSEERHLRPRSVRGALHPLRGLGTWLVENGYLERSPAHDVAMPKKDPAQRYVVTDADLMRLLEATDRQRDRVRASYERAMLSLLIYTGARSSELEAMCVSHIDLQRRTIVLPITKGGKTRTLYLTEEAAAALTHWLSVRPTVSHDWLWPANAKHRKSIETMRRDLEDIKARAGLAHLTHLKPHSARHRFATRQVENGASLLDVQASLGHTSLDTTYQYLHQREAAASSMATYARIAPNPPQEPHGPLSSPSKPTRADLVSRMRRRPAK